MHGVHVTDPATLRHLIEFQLIYHLNGGITKSDFRIMGDKDVMRLYHLLNIQKDREAEAQNKANRKAKQKRR